MEHTHFIGKILLGYYKGGPLSYQMSKCHEDNCVSMATLNRFRWVGLESPCFCLPPRRVLLVVISSMSHHYHIHSFLPFWGNLWAVSFFTCRHHLRIRAPGPLSRNQLSSMNLGYTAGFTQAAGTCLRSSPTISLPLQIRYPISILNSILGLMLLAFFLFPVICLEPLNLPNLHSLQWPL